MRAGWSLVLVLSLVAFESWARIGDSLKGLEERYGNPKETKQKDGGLIVVRYDKDGLVLSFSLLSDKTEEVDIKGNLSEKEAEVFLARNVPTGTTFSVNDNPLVPLIFRGTSYKEYSFSDKTTAYLVGVGGQKQLVIKTPKMVEFETWQTENEKRKELAKANERADKIESKSQASPKKEYGLAPEGTELRAYQDKIHSAINSRFNSRVSQNMTQIGVDRVVIRFRVNPDGSISELDVIKGNSNSMLSVIASDSIQQSSNLIGQFSESLKSERPDGFETQLEFKIQ